MIPVIIQYTSFVVQLCSVKDTWSRAWNPKKGDYDKNYFTTYFYSGSIDEYDLNDNIVTRYENEHVLTTSIVLDFPTKEIYNKTIWMCFSSWKPMSSIYHRLIGEMTIPANVGVYNLLGTFAVTDNEKLYNSRILNYIKPRPYDITIKGDAKILLITQNKFINVPPI